MRRAPAAILSLLVSLPAAGSALVVLSAPPLSGLLPAFVERALAPAAELPFRLVARLPSGSLAARLFYGSFAPLPAIFGSAALAVHAALLGLPWLGLALLVASRARREA